MYRHPIGALSRGAVLDVGLKCTHSCKFCYYSYLDRSDDQFRGMRRAHFRSLAECKQILDGLRAHGFLNFDYTGGEPTLHPDIVEITRYAHRTLGLAGRIITLGQFLMRRMPNCRQPRLIDDLLDAGLVNFLFSFHAADPALFERITGEELGRLTAAMDHLDARGFQYTTNTTVFEWNFRHLPDIARALVGHRTYLHNFILMNAYYEWNRDGRAFGVQARYSEVAPYLREAIAILAGHGIAANVRYAPLCAVRGLEQHLVGMVGVRYDAYEWMNRAGHFGGPPAECAAPLPVLQGDIDAHLAWQPRALRLPNGVEVIGARGNDLKHFPAACGGCAARSVCDGVDPNYLRQHGADEFAPYAGGEWTAPVHGARARYTAPFVVKTDPEEDMRAACAGPPAAALPRVSVVIPCYNYARYLPEAVASVLTQTYRHFEVIIVDDGSTDDSIAVAARLQAEHPEHAITIVAQPNSGQPALARNAGIARARGAYVLCLDADDIIAPTMLESCVRVLDADPDIAIVYTDRRDFDGVDQVVYARNWDFQLLRHANHLSYCALFRRPVWQAIGGFRDNVRGCEDWDFWVAAGARGFRGYRIPEPLFWYRRHDTGVFQEVVDDLPRLGAQIVLNNREAYAPDEVARAERMVGGRGSALPPLVSVVIPTRNRPDRLRAALASVLAQTHEHLEVIVVNDGGVDVEPVVAGFDDARIVSVKLGVGRERSAARNAALRLARGEYVAYLDDDDRWEPEHLETLVGVLERTGHDVAYGDARREWEEDRDGTRVVTRVDQPYSADFDRATLLAGNYIPTVCLVHRRACLDTIGLFDETLDTHEDWDLLIRLSQKYEFVHVPLVTASFSWREDGSSTTSRRRLDFLRTAQIVHARYPAGSDARVAARRASILAGLASALGTVEYTCSVVLVLRDDVERTRRCLGELADVTRGVDFEVIAVDAGSTDGTPAFIATLGGDVQSLHCERSRSWASAANLGARAARGRHLVFLAPETIPREGWLRALVDEVEAHPDVAVVGAKQLRPDGTIWHAGFAVSRVHAVPYPIYRGFPASFPGARRRREAQAVSGACLLARHAAFVAFGGFDEEFAGRWADVDLCLRVRESQGRVVYQPRSVVWQDADDRPGAADRIDAERLERRWATRWLPDDDATYVADGYARRTRDADGALRERLEPLTDGERARWERVAEVQRVAGAGGVDAARPLLDEPDAWPDDADVLAWAASLCARAGLTLQAARFRSRVHAASRGAGRPSYADAVPDAATGR